MPEHTVLAEWLNWASFMHDVIDGLGFLPAEVNRLICFRHFLIQQHFLGYIKEFS